MAAGHSWLGWLDVVVKTTMRILAVVHGQAASWICKYGAGNHWPDVVDKNIDKNIGCAVCGMFSPP